MPSASAWPTAGADSSSDGASAARPTAGAQADSARPTAPPAPDPDELLSRLDRRHLDELARRLAEPLGRIARAEDHLGRERAGRLFDGWS
jgi:hypothetical protein